MHIKFSERKQLLHSCPFLPKGTLRGRGMILLRVWVPTLPQVCLLECVCVHGGIRVYSMRYIVICFLVLVV